MSSSDVEYEIGYKRPPQRTKWKKGQCGNPKRKRYPKVKAIDVLVDEFFASMIWLTENGERRRCTAFEAIFQQLCIRASGGDKRAARLMLKYIDFGKMRGGTGEVRLFFRDDNGRHVRVPPAVPGEPHLRKPEGK